MALAAPGREEATLTAEESGGPEGISGPRSCRILPATREFQQVPKVMKMPSMDGCHGANPTAR